MVNANLVYYVELDRFLGKKKTVKEKNKIKLLRA